MTELVLTPIMPGLSSECRVVQRIIIEGVEHLIVCTREEPGDKIYGLRQAGQFTVVSEAKEQDHVRG